MAEQPYGENVRKHDRLQVTVVAYDDGGSTEVFWSRSNDILTMNHEGSVQLQPDGSLHMRLNRDDGEPLSLAVYGNRIVVRHTEDMGDGPPSAPVVAGMTFDPDLEADDSVIFDSDFVKLTSS